MNSAEREEQDPERSGPETAFDYSAATVDVANNQK